MDPLAVARDLAGRHPQAVLPCPLCAAGVKGTNLDRHVATVHAGRDVAAVRAWSGPERLVLRPLVAIPLLAAGGVVAWSWRSERELRPWFLVTAAVVLIFVVLAGLAAADKPVFVGRLSLRGNAARLRHTLLLLTRTVQPVEQVRVGSAYRTVPMSGTTSSDSGSTGSYDVPAGVYLQLRRGRRTITVHCRTSTDLRATWTGWRQGPRRRRWDVTLSAGDFVGLQYELAAAGLLQLRAEPR